MSVYRIGTFVGNSWTPGIEIQGKKKKKRYLFFQKGGSVHSSVSAFRFETVGVKDLETFKQRLPASIRFLTES